MAFKFDFKTVFFAGLLVSGCADEAPDPSAAQEGDNATGETTADAGKKADAGKDAGKDAGSSADDDGDDTSDDTSDDTGSEDAGKPTLDAGTVKADAGSVKADAGTTKVDAGGGTDAGSAGGTCAELTYETFGKSFLETYCLSCHTKMKPTLTTLAEVVTNKAKVKAEAATGKAMPPKTAPKMPTDAERTKLGQWIDCGPK